MLVRALTAVTLALSLLVGPNAWAQEPVTQADLNRLRSEIELLKQDIEIKEAELRVMELQLARQSGTPTPIPAPKPAAKPVKTVAPKPAEVAMPAAPVAAAPLKRANVDPRPYEAAATGRLNFFRTTQSSNWLVLDEKRLVFWVLDDEAYLLTLSHPCAGLLDAERIKLENFSNKVRAGQDGVVFNDQMCLIETITKLSGRTLPKPPRK
ncbi:MAG: DUF6491 family protein [Arenimonas sp.]